MHLLAIDPGLRGSGAALFDEETRLLLRADYVKGSPTGEMAEAWNIMAVAIKSWANLSSGGRTPRLVIEFPKVRQRGSQRAAKKGTDPNDLLQLAAVVGAVAAYFGSIRPSTVLLPEEWKQQVPKSVMWDRALKRLSPAELATMGKVPERLAHNMHDAIELGLVHVGRLGKFSEPVSSPVAPAGPRGFLVGL